MKKLAVYTLGFLQVPYIRRMLATAGWKVVPGPVSTAVDAVGVWGRKPRAQRGIDAASRRNLPLISIEDAFLRSVHPGPRQAPMGLVLDDIGIYFDASAPSRLENILAKVTDDPLLMARARAGIDFLKCNGLSKYNPVAPGGGLPDGYVLVIDQTRGDASLRHGCADAQTFGDMLATARKDFPTAKIVIRAHPAVSAGGKSGHYSDRDLDNRTILLRDPVNPWDLLAGARAVYCATSQLGFEAILAGHRPKVFGMPFYAGWGLSDDKLICERRGRQLTVEQLFAGAMLEYPFWQPVFPNRQGCFEDSAQMLLARSRGEWRNGQASVAVGIRNWKRGRVSRFLSSRDDRPVFAKEPMAAARRAKARQGRVVVWASREAPGLQGACDAEGVDLWRMEDGFLRSTGLGAALVPAASLVVDDLGIYYDSTRESRLERLIAASVDLSEKSLERANKLAQQIVDAKVTKYNLPGGVNLPARDGRTRILVPGQVEDDASIRLGTDKVKTNRALLAETRAANPDAFIIYKPHPDVEAGLRPGAVENAGELADFVADNAPVAALLDQVDMVWTMTSLMGFEALMRGLDVACLGMPFYAGWGLTDDRGQQNSRRAVRPSLNGVIHASLIDYPLYLDPETEKPCPPEVLVARLAVGPARRAAWLTVLAKLQGWFSGYAHLWR